MKRKKCILNSLYGNLNAFRKHELSIYELTCVKINRIVMQM